MYSVFERILKERGISTATVSHGTGIKESVFSNWKTRNNYLSAENYIKVARFLNTTLDFLITGEESTHLRDTSPRTPAASHAQTPDEQALLDGFRAASEERREDMLDLAYKALKKDGALRSSRSAARGTPPNLTKTA